jgi:hypothetical protein
MREGSKLFFDFQKRGVGGLRFARHAALRAMYEAFCFPTLHRARPGSIPRATWPDRRGLIGALLWPSPFEKPDEASGAFAFGVLRLCKKSA